MQCKTLRETYYLSDMELLCLRQQYPKTLQEVEEMRQIPYRLAVGSLMYAMLCTRPNICYAVG
ncbi:gag/pol protein [Cucumis melo var. makuwa]|uniref:Gag/pol protein n=1 Tax=Cucumis melo var. makuwa TaxID=1194695 RepID=A0A5D3BC73_CUCMM|nr:gag/pol protein [Cucumis melo var. makuwa]